MVQKIVAIALSLFLFLLPAIAEAQANPQAKPGKPAAGAPGHHRPGKPGNAPNRPSKPNRPARPPHTGKPTKPRPPHGGRPHRPAKPQPGKPARPGRPGKPGVRPPHYSRPLPPRGNQFWHRGRYYGRIKGPAFVYPRGWHYRRYAIGALFPALFLNSLYYYNDYAALGLETPAPGYVWVRFGPDLVLVNLHSREIEDIVYGAFE